VEIKRFLEKLASDAPTPGGGSASALAGALSASLVAMVAGLTLKKEKTKKKSMEEIRKKAIAIQRKLLRAVDKDAESYQEVLKAFRLPQNTEEERLYRIKMIQRAYQKATVTPQLVCECSIQLLNYSNALIIKGTPIAISDAGVAAFLADAALGGGLLNIGVNLACMADRSFVKKMNLVMKQLTRKRKRMMKDILNRLERIKV